VLQNATDSCDYTLKFRTNLVCFGELPISGGWIFMIIVLGGSGLYILGGFAYSYARFRTLVFPNLDLWSEVNDLIFEGVVFVFSLGRKRARKTDAKGGDSGSFKPMFTGGAASSSAATSRVAFQAVSDDAEGGSFQKATATGSFTDL
jgi:hypothetical protein